MHIQTSPDGTSTRLVDVNRLRFGGLTACSVLRPLKPLEHGYFFGGFVVSGGIGVTANGGFEGAVDVFNQQAAVFGFSGAGIAGSAGIGAGPYTGIGTDLSARSAAAADIRNVWSGVFLSATASVGIEKFIAANASGFTSTDGTIAGASVGVTLGVGLELGTLADFSAQGSSYGFDADKTRGYFGGDGTTQAFFSTAREVTRAVLKVSPGVAFNGLGARELTSFLINAILKAKYAGTSISALCP